jgi:serine/threonine protein kinase
VTVSLADDITIMRMLNMDMIRELGRGGFGTVYEAANRTDRLKVALKIVKDPQNAMHAIREGQRLRRVRHRNIILMHKVYDFGDGSCALEMEVAPGGDLFQHLEACRRRPNARLPHDAVLRFSRQLLTALVYLHDELKWLHGDIKPQNILMQCDPVPSDGSAVDYSSAEIKLADFGLTKALDHQSAMSSLMLSTMVGMLKGTMLYLSPEQMQGASSGSSYERAVSDDLWSACLVILEMDTGMPIHQLMKGPGSVIIDELLTKASPELLPLLCSVLNLPSAASRCSSAAELLRMLDASLDPLFTWQLFDIASLKYVPVHPASSVFLERAFSAIEPLTGLPLPPPLDLNFDIQALLTSPAALGFQTERRSGGKCRIRRVLKASVSHSSKSIPTWQELIDGNEWLQCSPAICAKLDIEAKNPKLIIDTARYRHLALECGFIGQVQLPHPMKSEPYLAPARADDIAVLNTRVHDSLPEWDVTGMQQVVNASLASKYAAYRHRVASRCNGNPNERTMFHFADPAVMTKIWQQGEGHDPRLSNWAEVGKGAYFSKHVIYGYAYKYGLWPPPPSFTVKPEPPVGECMQVFVFVSVSGTSLTWAPAVKLALHLYGTPGRKSCRPYRNPLALLQYLCRQMLPRSSMFLISRKSKMHLYTIVLNQLKATWALILPQRTRMRWVGVFAT